MGAAVLEVAGLAGAGVVERPEPVGRPASRTGAVTQSLRKKPLPTLKSSSRSKGMLAEECEKALASTAPGRGRGAAGAAPRTSRARRSRWSGGAVHRPPPAPDLGGPAWRRRRRLPAAGEREDQPAPCDLVLAVREHGRPPADPTRPSAARTCAASGAASRWRAGIAAAYWKTASGLSRLSEPSKAMVSRPSARDRPLDRAGLGDQRVDRRPSPAPRRRRCRWRASGRSGCRPRRRS